MDSSGIVLLVNLGTNGQGIEDFDVVFLYCCLEKFGSTICVFLSNWELFAHWRFDSRIGRSCFFLDAATLLTLSSRICALCSLFESRENSCRASMGAFRF